MKCFEFFLTHASVKRQMDILKWYVAQIYDFGHANS